MTGAQEFSRHASNMISIEYKKGALSVLVLTCLFKERHINTVIAHRTKHLSHVSSCHYGLRPSVHSRLLICFRGVELEAALVSYMKNYKSEKNTLCQDQSSLHSLPLLPLKNTRNPRFEKIRFILTTFT